MNMNTHEYIYIYTYIIHIYYMRDARHPTSPSLTIRPENGADPAPKHSKNEGQGPSFRGPEGFWVPLKTELDRDPVPEPNPLISAAPFLPIFRKNGLQIETPIFLKIADQVFLRWPKTASRAENTKNRGVEKGTSFVIRFGFILGGILKRN